MAPIERLPSQELQHCLHSFPPATTLAPESGFLATAKFELWTPRLRTVFFPAATSVGAPSLVDVLKMLQGERPLAVFFSDKLMWIGIFRRTVMVVVGGGALLLPQKVG
jgi:hypothetical protein